MSCPPASVAPECPTILVLSTNAIELLGLSDVFLGEPGTPILTAVVTAQLFEADGITLVGGVPDPIPMPFVPASLGDYRGEIPATAALAVSDRFRAVITALDGGNTFREVLQGIVVE